MARADILGWGETMKLARRASMLASEDARKQGFITDPLQSSIMLYTDDPTAAIWFAAEPDMYAICKASAIEGVCTVIGEKFPPASFEAERDDLELPRVAAMWFPPPGEKCPRCRNYRRTDGEICAPCAKTVEIA